MRDECYLLMKSFPLFTPALKPSIPRVTLINETGDKNYSLYSLLKPRSKVQL